jgi:hypothetical protein
VKGNVDEAEKRVPSPPGTTVDRLSEVVVPFPHFDGTTRVKFVNDFTIYGERV